MKEFQITDRPLWKSPPAAVARETKKSTAAQKLAEAYAVVNERDGDRDRVTGQRLLASSPDKSRRREHHHIQSRGSHPELIAVADNIMLCSSLVHELIEHGLIVVIGLDASKKLDFKWRDDVPKEQRVVRIMKK